MSILPSDSTHIECKTGKMENAMSQFKKFEEYKLFVEDTARFSERRQTVTNIYTVVNSILLTGIAILVKDSGLQNRAIAISSIAILIAGISVCGFWFQLIKRYKGLVGLRLTEIRFMEELPEMVGCHQMFHKEDELYPRDQSGQLLKRGFLSTFSDLELGLPILFISIYTAFIIGIIWVWSSGLI